VGDCAASRCFIERVNIYKGWRNRGWDGRTGAEQRGERHALHREQLLRRQHSSGEQAASMWGAPAAGSGFRRVCV